MKPHLVVQALTQAEGYLELDLPDLALRCLARCDDYGALDFEGNYLNGEALRALERYDQAVAPLRAAVGLRPGAVAPRVALGWCLKRTSRLEQAIGVLEEVVDTDDVEAIVPFNLACYWCVAGDHAKALALLEKALQLDPNYARHAVRDADLDGLRGEPAFQRLVGGSPDGPADTARADPSPLRDPEAGP